MAKNKHENPGTAGESSGHIKENEEGAVMTEQEDKKTVLTTEQQQRAEALRMASGMLKSRGFLSSGAVQDTDAVLTLAMFILHGVPMDTQTGQNDDPGQGDTLAIESPLEATAWFTGLKIDPSYRGEYGYPPRGSLLRVTDPVVTLQLVWWESDGTGFLYTRGINQPRQRVTDQTGMLSPTVQLYPMGEVLESFGTLTVEDVPCVKHDNAGPWCAMCLNS